MMSLEKYKLIIFDCDGTLVDSEMLSNTIISEILSEIGINFSPFKCLQEFKGKPFQKIIDFIYARDHNDFDFDFEKEFRKRCKIAFEKDLKAIPYALEFAKQLKTEFCIASNGPKEKMEVSLSTTGFLDFTPKNKIYSAYDIDAFKPDPALFLLVAQQQNVMPKDCLVFEDTQSGIEAALAAQMDVIGIIHPQINNDILSYSIPFIRTYKSLIH